MSEWNGRKVIILGAARQGLALARWLARQGAEVVLNDNRPLESFRSAQAALAAELTADGADPSRVTWVCGGHPLELLDGASLLCPSGGVPLDQPLVVAALERGIPLSNDSQIFLEAAPCQVIGITGSAGKTTTTTLVGRMAEAAARAGLYRRAYVGGNIGAPLIAVMDEMQSGDLAVMELSSFQLEIMTRSPHVAAILNVTPNHLDRHGTMEAYTAAKAHIFAFQPPASAGVLGREDPGAWALRGQVPGRLFSFGRQRPAGDPGDPAAHNWEGTFVQGEWIYLRQAGQELPVLERSAILLRGEHNLLNVLAACAIAAAAGLPPAAIQAGVNDFRGVPHRLAFVRRWRGADWYNDSIATAPERAMAAIRSFDEPLIVLAGGRDKRLPWGEFAALVRSRVDHLVVFGEAAGLIQAAVEAAPAAEGGRPFSLTRCAGLTEAVAAAAGLAQPGQVILLSPGGTSFDEFRDFEERGECFARLVNRLP